MPLTSAPSEFDTPLDWNSDFEELVRRLQTPSILENLSFTRCDELVTVLPWFLPTLTGLDTLELVDSDFYDFTPDLCDTLRQSSISSLTSPASASKTKRSALVSGPSQMSKLRTLTLCEQRWQAVKGLRATKLFGIWTLPKWGDGMEGRVEEVVETARRNEVEVKGSILEGIEADKAYAGESERLERLIRELF